jgi:hypothetical protein
MMLAAVPWDWPRKEDDDHSGDHQAEANDGTTARGEGVRLFLWAVSLPSGRRVELFIHALLWAT